MSFATILNQGRTRSSTSGSLPVSPLHINPLRTSPKTENVKVTVRMRPPSFYELETSTIAQMWDIDPCDNRIALSDEFIERTRRPPLAFTFDRLITGSDNGAIYDRSVRDVVQSAMDGYNGTVFAYGQTASGKTYTMSGTADQPGVIPQTIDEVFSCIRHSAGQREFLLRVSYLEIYNETIRDLLSPSTADLKIHDDKRRGVYVSGLREEVVTSPGQMVRILKLGEANRHIGSTDFNEHSSRSHSLFQLVIESRECSPSVGAGHPFRLRSNSNSFQGDGVRISQLNLIDLAGSEKASGSAERRKEGAFINKSLLTLGTVIAKLTEDKVTHIPFRDSKLTRILQSSLSGHARVSVICTVSPAQINYEESINTLKFAARVKRVTTRAETYQVRDDKALLQKYRLEILELKNKLMQVNQNLDREGELSQLRKEKKKYEEEIMQMRVARVALKERIDHLTKLILTSSSVASKAIIGTSPQTPRTSVVGAIDQAHELAEWQRRNAIQADEIAQLKHQLAHQPPPAMSPTPPLDVESTLPYRQLQQTVADQQSTLVALKDQLAQSNKLIQSLRDQLEQLRMRPQVSEAATQTLAGECEQDLPDQTASPSTIATSPTLRGQSPRSSDELSSPPRSPSIASTTRARSPPPWYYPMGRQSPLFQRFYPTSPPIQVNTVSEARIKDLQKQLANEKQLHKNNISQYRQKIAALEADVNLYKGRLQKHMG
ncbi:Kinesin-like protein kip2 [Dimargaris xerosporica]|nr:Kinesin-like protein kip2 [Dimargaris xerosporica]